MNNDLDSAIRFLETGINPNELKELEVKYSESPLFYLILEITDFFLNFQIIAVFVVAP